MKKNIFSLKKCLFLALPLILTNAVGCTPNDNPELKNKTELKVWVFAGGYGTGWFKQLKTEFEEAVKDICFEGESSEKKGVFITPDYQLEAISDTKFSNYKSHVYLTEQVNFSLFKAKDFLEDITEAVTTQNEFDDNKTILSKMDDSQKNYFGYTEQDEQVHYYGIPHYSGTHNMVYDHELFKQKGAFYKAGHPEVTSGNQTFENCFTKSGTLAPGPDGISGTQDDGLPATFDEFYYLCDKLASDDLKPLVWSGKYASEYLSAFSSSLLTSLQGGDQSRITYTMDGTTSNLVKVNNSNEVIMKDGYPEIDTTSKVITQENGYEITRTKAAYDTLTFLKKIYKNNENYSWRASKSFNSQFTHTDAENDFIWAKDPSRGVTERSAILFDGTWWQAEAADTFANMEIDNEEYGINKRDFRMLPYPKAQSSDTYYKTFYESLNTSQFVKKGLTEAQKKAAIAFLKFCNSDDQLQKFTVNTNTSRCLKYDLTTEQLDQLSPYAKSVFNYRSSEDCEIVYPSSKNPVVMDNNDYFTYEHLLSTAKGQKIFKVIQENPELTAEQLFNSHYGFYKNNWTIWNS